MFRFRHLAMIDRGLQGGLAIAELLVKIDYKQLLVNA